MIKNLIALTLAAVVALSGTTDAAPLPTFAKSRKVHRLGAGAGAKALGHLGRSMGKLRKAGVKFSGSKKHPFPSVGKVMIAGKKHATRFAARQDADPTPPQVCMPKYFAADGCANFETAFRVLMNNGGFADAAAKEKFCVTDKCDEKVVDFFTCWRDNGSAADNTQLPSDARGFFAIELCAASGLDFTLKVPQACASTIGSCDKDVVADILNAGDLPVIRGNLDKFCKDDCFRKAPALFDCLETEGILDAADKPTAQENAAAKNFMCARGKANGGDLCYNGLRAVVKSKCFEDFPDDMENESVLAAWMSNKQESFCQRQCGVISNKALICLAEARASFPGESEPVKLDTADAAFTDLLCLRDGVKGDGEFCIKELASLEKAAEKSIDTLTESDLTGICSTCTKRIIQRLATANVDGIKEHAGTFGVMCIQDEGKFCLPQLPKAYKDEVFGENDPNASDDDDNDDDEDDAAPTKEVLDAVCTTRCARRFTYRLIELDEALDEENGATTASEAQKKKRRAAARAEVEFYCFKNNAGTYCATLEDSGFEKATCPAIKSIGEEGLPFESGTDININTNTCSDNCKAEVTKFGTDLGCCFGLYMDQLETMIISEEDFDDDPNSAERQFLTKFVSNLKAGFKVCGADADAGDLVSCAKPSGTKKATITVKTSIPSKVAKGKAAGKFSGAVRKDACIPSMGVNDLMKNCQMKETLHIKADTISPDGKVTAAADASATSSNKALAALQATGDTNVAYVIEFQGKDDAATAKFESSYKTAVANNDITASATSEVLKKETGSSLQSVNFDQSQKEAAAEIAANEQANESSNSTAAAVVVSSGAVTLAVLAALA